MLSLATRCKAKDLSIIQPLTQIEPHLLRLRRHRQKMSKLKGLKKDENWSWPLRGVYRRSFKLSAHYVYCTINIITSVMECLWKVLSNSIVPKCYEMDRTWERACKAIYEVYQQLLRALSLAVQTDWLILYEGNTGT